MNGEFLVEGKIFTAVEIVQVAKNQTFLLYCVLAKLLFYLVGLLMGPVMPIVGLAVIVCSIVFFVKLRLAMKKGLPLTIVAVILLFIPLVGLLTLLINSAAATKILRSAGLKVGLMGVSASQLAQFANR